MSSRHMDLGVPSATASLATASLVAADGTLDRLRLPDYDGSVTGGSIPEACGLAASDTAMAGRR